MAWIRLAKVTIERTDHRSGRWQSRRLPPEHSRHVDGRDHTRGGALRVPLDAGELAGKHDRGFIAQREMRRQAGRRVEIGVAMDLPVAKKLGVGQSRDHSENALLFRDAQPSLKADEVPHHAGAILLTELHHGPRAASRAGIVEPNGFHGTEAECLAAALRHDLDRYASFEI